LHTRRAEWRWQQDGYHDGWAAKSARWDELTSDPKDEIIILSGGIAIARRLTLFSPFLGFHSSLEVAFRTLGKTLEVITPW
jgi:hypothetical protein